MRSGVSSRMDICLYVYSIERWEETRIGKLLYKGDVEELPRGGLLLCAGMCIFAYILCSRFRAAGGIMVAFNEGIIF